MEDSMTIDEYVTSELKNNKEYTVKLLDKVRDLRNAMDFMDAAGFTREAAFKRIFRKFPEPGEATLTGWIGKIDPSCIRKQYIHILDSHSMNDIVHYFINELNDEFEKETRERGGEAMRGRDYEDI